MQDCQRVRPHALTSARSLISRLSMKTEFIDVSETQKNLVVEIPSTVVDAEIDKVVARLQQGGAHSRLPAGQGAGEGRAPAVPRSDPARRGARADPARGGRGAARARRRAGRHARHPRRRRRRRAAAQVHGDLRDGAADRTGRLREHHAAPEERARSTTRPSTRRWRACAIARRATSRSKGAGSRTATRCVMDLVRTATAEDRDRETSRSSSSRASQRAQAAAGTADGPPRRRHGRHRRAGQSARVRRGADRPERRANRRRSTSTIRTTTRSRSSPGTTVSYDVTVKAIRKRIVPELDDEFAKDLGEFDEPRRAAHARARRPRARGDARSGARRARRAAEAAGRARDVRRARVAARSRDRPARRGVRPPADRSADRSDEDEHQLGGVPREAAGRGVRGGARRAGPRRGGAARAHRGDRGGDRAPKCSGYAERSGRTAAAVRARLEKEGGLARLYSGMRREKTIDFLLSRATKIQT